MSSSSLDVGLGTRKELVLANDVVVFCGWLECLESWDMFGVPDLKRGVSLEPKVLRARPGVVGKCRRCLCLLSIITLSVRPSIDGPVVDTAYLPFSYDRDL